MMSMSCHACGRDNAKRGFRPRPGRRRALSAAVAAYCVWQGPVGGRLCATIVAVGGHDDCLLRRGGRCRALSELEQLELGSETGPGGPLPLALERRTSAVQASGGRWLVPESNRGRADGRTSGRLRPAGDSRVSDRVARAERTSCFGPSQPRATLRLALLSHLPARQPPHTLDLAWCPCPTPCLPLRRPPPLSSREHGAPPRS